MKSNPSIKQSGNPLLNQFNKRNMTALGEVYKLFYRDFLFIGRKFFSATEIQAEDVIQDLFIAVWEDQRIQFQTFEDIKAYMYAAIRNKYKDYLKHLKHIHNHQQLVKKNEPAWINIAETEIFSILSQTFEMMPAECAKVFRLHIDGWNVKEIAEKLNKSESTVYKQRQDAINILKKKLSMGDFFLLFNFFLTK